MRPVFLGIGGNLVPDGFASVRDGLVAAIDMLAGSGFLHISRSSWYETAPVPISDQPWYVNAVIAAQTSLAPEDALAALHKIEAQFGRTRSVRNAARVLDIDLLDLDGLVRGSAELTLPHPRMHDRAFVLLPLRDVAPAWRHPVSGMDISAMMAAMPTGQDIRRAD
ncbi:MAG: 2-amino-4-hydroxy-6-hydroxymethyldihydropteridine diphosphokinase [Rhodospirillaceae bacterium]|jgi:2-amino-4-hydroxy-6-hydroxymethyldihydropteridine diphosphokinase|nr:2-amino-4-hydroxy-6-hydroxymethyldihydropteridine diphosphokinase [Rhodospirillaceae bacterium]